MSEITVSYTYKYGGWSFDGEAEVEDSTWSEMDSDDRNEYLRDSACADFNDSVEIVESSINDEN